MTDFFQNPLDQITRAPCDRADPLPAAMLTSLQLINRRLREALAFSEQAIEAMQQSDQREAVGILVRASVRARTAQDLMTAVLILDDETSIQTDD